MSAIPKASFIRYLRAFNARDYQTQHSFYADDIILYLPATAPLRGKEAVQAQYDKVHLVVDEAVVPIDIVQNSRTIIVPKRTIFRLRRNLPDFLGLKDLQRGDIIVFAAYLHYHFNNEGKIQKIDLTAFSDNGEFGPRLLPKGEDFLEVVNKYQAEAAEDFGVWDAAAMKGTAYLD